MRKLRFYYPEKLVQFHNVNLDQKSHHHIKHVLRLQEGDMIELFDNQENVANAKIMKIGRSEISAEIGKVEKISLKSPIFTHIGQVVAKSTAMDFFVQKATELGASKITPLVGDRTNLRKTASKWEEKKHHWESISISACAQSYRNDLPIVGDVMSVDEWAAQSHEGCKLILDPGVDSNVGRSLPEDVSYNLLFGPEGGFSEREVELAIHHGFQPILLGPRVLRVETASLATLSILQYQFGDFT